MKHLALVAALASLGCQAPGADPAGASQNVSEADARIRAYRDDTLEIRIDVVVNGDVVLTWDAYPLDIEEQAREALDLVLSATRIGDRFVVEPAGHLWPDNPEDGEHLVQLLDDDDAVIARSPMFEDRATAQTYRDGLVATLDRPVPVDRGFSLCKLDVVEMAEPHRYVIALLDETGDQYIASTISPTVADAMGQVDAIVAMARDPANWTIAPSPEHDFVPGGPWFHVVASDATGELSLSGTRAQNEQDSEATKADDSQMFVHAPPSCLPTAP